ncbi:MAG TPA: sugar transferase [Planctomycetota bacterium]|nr:sugar transferase [Planctomycetota bacterium]
MPALPYAGRNAASGHGLLSWRAQLTGIALLISDLLAALAAYVLAGEIYASALLDSLRHRPTLLAADAMIIGLAAGALMVLIFVAQGLYRRGVSILNVEEDALLFRGLTYHALLVLGCSFVMQPLVPRAFAVLAIAVTLLTVMVGRRTVRAIGNRLLSAGVGSQPALIYGAGDTGRQMAHRLLANPQFGLRPVGFIDDAMAGRTEPVPFGPGRKWSLSVLGRGSEFPEMLRRHGAGALVLAMPTLDTDRLVEVQEKCKELGVACYRVPLCHGSHLRRFNLTFVGDMPLVSERFPSLGLEQRIAKRLFDVAASAALLLLLSPLLLLIAALVRLTSPGPVIFRQERIGLLGRPFAMFKFRSMRVDAPAYAQKPREAGDPRVYALGRLLRKTSLDELPQLWNVLCGEMSLVGPRPEMPQIVAGYDALHRERLLVKPGITGLWQVSGDRNLPISEGLDYDLYYLYNRSFALDLAILARTPFTVCGGR